MTIENATPEELKLLKIRQVMAMTGLARSTVYKYCSDNGFPKPIQLGKRNSAWLEKEVCGWIAERVNQRDMAS